MSSSQNFPHKNSQKPSPETSPPNNWNMVPPPKRDQRPKPEATQSPQLPFPAGVPNPLAAAALQHPVTAPVPATPQTPLPKPHPKKRGFNNWVLWAFVAVAAFGGIAGASAISLLRIPNLPNCRAIFWPMASAATRLQCADAYADQGSVESLLAAISLVEALPDDHPLRADIDERVELWANQILQIADQTFNDGKLEEAIDIARKIPENTAAADEVSDRISTWRETWEQAESIFREAEAHLRASKFREAFTAAIKLRSIDNDYWANQRYEELVDLITQTRKDVNALANAERLADGGTVEDILEALQQVMAIGEESYAYEEAQRVLKDISRRLLDLAEDALIREDSAEALNIIGKIPPEARLDEEVADFRTLIDAYELTWPGTTAGLEAAIVRLQSIGSDRPLYAKAQELKERWRGELDGLSKLNWARQIARPGSVESLVSAIAEAEKIDSTNPLWDETQAQIEEWQEAIARIKDQPILDRARLMAVAGDRGSLQAAIAEAENISTNSALYDEAQDLIADWRWRVQRMDNEPILAQAREVAATGDLSQAVAIASQISPNEALYDEAEAAIADWESEMQGQQSRQSYQQALALAQTGTVDALINAIAIAQGISEASADWSLAQQAANQWSWDLLEAAEAAAIQDPTEGIAIASRIPPRTEAYAEAQLRLRDWQGASERQPPLNR